MVIKEQQLTIGEFEAFLQLPHNQNRQFELINGTIREMSPTEEHGMLVLNIGALILAYAKLHNLERASVETRYQMPDDKHNSRIPDIAFSCHSDDPIVKKVL